MIEPVAPHPAVRSWTVFRRLLRLAAPFRWWMALSAVLGFLTIGSSIALMSAGAWLIASAALHPPLAHLSLAIVGVRFFGISRGVFRYLERYVSHLTTFRLLARLRVWFFRAVEPLAPARLTQHRSGDLLSRAVSDIDTLENMYLRVLAPPAIATLVGLMMMIFMGLYDLWLAVSLVFFLVLAGVGVPLLTNRLSHTLGPAMRQTHADLSVAVIDGVQGLADLTAFNATDRHLAHLRKLNAKLHHQHHRMARIAALNGALISLLTGMALVATLLIAIPLVTQGRLDGVMLAVLALATMSSFEAVQNLPQAAQHFSANLAAAGRLFELADTPNPIPETASNGPTSPPCDDTRTPGTSQPLLSVQRLSFRYGVHEPLALDDLTFEMEPGATVAIVGASGAGKTTLANVLLRFWDYSEGLITLLGYDMRDLAPEQARACISVVSQRTYLFNATIRENLRLAAPDVSDEALQHALAAAHLDQFVAALPDGLDTWIGEQGVGLSGGERQRMAIARALLKRTPLLLLDEATANLDTVTERAVLETIFTALADRTTLMITHRLVGLERADSILVLHQGQVIERGTQAELLRLRGHYYRLWHQQQRTLDLARPVSA